MEILRAPDRVGRAGIFAKIPRAPDCPAVLMARLQAAVMAPFAGVPPPQAMQWACA
jgi:hypothetical protein